jgi:predicted nuclease of predicted toxin-antitoxin system
LSFRFQADADLNPEIGRGLLRREPTTDFRGAAGVIPDGTPDPEVLQIAAEVGRVLVSRDVTTMPDHFDRFVALHESPGVLLIPSRRSISEVIEGLLLVWLTWSEEDLRNHARWLSDHRAEVRPPAGGWAAMSKLDIAPSQTVPTTGPAVEGAPGPCLDAIRQRYGLPLCIPLWY